MARWFDAQSADFEADFAAFLQEPRGGGEDGADATAAAIVADVRARGGAAVAEYTAKFDRLEIDPESLSAQAVDLDALAEQCPSDVREAIEFAATRIRAYHAAQLPEDHRFTDAAGVDLGWRWTPIEAVGLYVPGGRASYPSSVLMNAIPAVAAGVTRMVMTVPAPGGVLSPAVAYAAKCAGVTEYYPIGGAQSVAALAYGAGALKPVDKIVGPGNAYVAAAKRLVFGDVGIDTIAGPSEICVVADAKNDPSWIAADLLSQAEHDPAAQSILITDDKAFGEAVIAAIDAQLAALSTAEDARASWSAHGAIVLAPLDAAPALVDKIAPEHVELAVEDPEAMSDAIRHAGAIFLGRWAPEALGDYVTGSNHVLPTSGAARFSSGLSVLDFMKRSSIQRISPEAFRALAGPAQTLAAAEGLPAHGRSMAIRTNRPDDV